MNKIINLQKIQLEAKKERENTYVHAQASIVVLEKCMTYLNMNNLSELQNVKNTINKTLKELREIKIDGK